MPVARRALPWSREVAASVKPPLSGVEVLATGDRAPTSAHVMPGGEIVLRHVFPPYFAAEVVGRRAEDVSVPVAVLNGLVEAIESGGVWEHAERSLARTRTR